METTVSEFRSQTNEPIDQLTNQPTDYPTNRPTNQLTNQPTYQIIVDANLQFYNLIVLNFPIFRRFLK